jgi:hypothetical protein
MLAGGIFFFIKLYFDMSAFEQNTKFVTCK